MSDRTQAQPPRRGRPRSEKTRAAIVCAARDLLAEGGMAAATMEAIAARAGCSKATIYKWWPSRAAVLLDGLFDLTRESIAVPEGVGTEEALRSQLAATLAIFRAGATGPLLRTLAGEAVSEPAVADALRDQWIGPRRVVCLRILRDAVARGRAARRHRSGGRLRPAVRPAVPPPAVRPRAAGGRPAGDPGRAAAAWP